MDPGRLRRIVVVGGNLVAELGSPRGRFGRIELVGVEIAPQRGRLRAVVGAVRASWSAGGLIGRASFPRASIDVALSDLGRARLLASGGDVALDSRGGALRIVDVVVSHGLMAEDPTGELLSIDGRVVRPGTDHRMHARLTRASGQVSVEVSGQDVPLAPLGVLFPHGIDTAQATASGRARFTLTGPPRRSANVDADLGIRGLILDHPSVATRPIAIDGRVSGRGSTFEIAGRRYATLDDAVIGVGEVALTARGRAEFVAERALPERADLVVELAPTDCGRAIASLPEAMRGELAGFEASGTMAGSLAVSFDRFDPDDAALDVTLDMASCRVVAEPQLADPRSLFETFVRDLPGGGTMRVGRSEPDYTPLARLPSHVVGAWVAAEDARYWTHAGFDAYQIERSLAIDLAQGELLRGGSTISQQLVKNVFLDPQRTLARKLQEAVLTWRLEATLSKRDILERYVNLIELGDGVHGVTAAARHWFDKPPERLTVREAAFLAALTPAPRTMSARIRELGGLDPFSEHRVEVVLRAMRQSGVIDDATYARARGSKLRLSKAVASRQSSAM
jgi:hypothetical protein